MDLSKKRGRLAAILGNVIFGFSYLFTGGALQIVREGLTSLGLPESADVPVLLTLRSLLALAILSLMIPLCGQRLQLRGKPVWKLILLGLFQPVLYFIGETYGLKMTGIVVSSVMISLLPVFSQFFSAAFLKEKTNLAQTLFGLLSVGGVITVTLLSSGSDQKTYLSGILLLCLAVASAVAFNLLGRSICTVFTPFERTYAMFAVAAVCFSLIALCSVRGNLNAFILPLGSGEFLLRLLYLGGLSSVAAFFLVNYAKTCLPVTEEASFSNVITVVSTASGLVTETDPRQILLLALLCLVIVAGVCGVQLFAPKEETTK